MSEGAIDEPKGAAGGGRSWLHEQGIQLMLLVGSAMTAVCYLVGRAGLLGWYEAAGVPQLKFSWSVQDVLVRGFADTDTWLLVGAVVVICALYFVVIDLASGRITKWAQSWERFRMRGESLDRVNLRRRWALAARVARQKRLPSAERLSLDWRTLEVRGRFRKARTDPSICDAAQ